MPSIAVQRIYDLAPGSSTRHRVLVDRLWPRGVTKADAPVDEWVKEVAPSTDLRRWYDHRVDRFDEFVRRYRVELTRQFARDAVDRLRTVARSNGLILVGCPGFDVAAISGIVRLLSLVHVELRTRRV